MITLRPSVHLYRRPSGIWTDGRETALLFRHLESGSSVCIEEDYDGFSEAQGHWYIDLINVPNRFRRQGIGTLLLQTMKGEALARRIKAVWLVNGGEPWCQRFYEKHGFRNSAEDDVRMVWRVPKSFDLSLAFSSDLS